jgi:hypothetical protein
VSEVRQRVALVVAGVACLLVTPWFALAYFSAYGGVTEAPPPWGDWVDWPALISGDPVDVYNRYGVFFGAAMLVAVVAFAALIRASTVQGSRTRRAWNVVVGGLGAAAVGSLLEYGLGDVIDPGFGFFAELLGFAAVIVGTVLLGGALRSEANVPLMAAVPAGLSGFLAVALGVGLVGHIPSGPAFFPLGVLVVMGLRGMPRNTTGSAVLPQPSLRGSA